MLLLLLECGEEINQALFPFKTLFLITLIDEIIQISQWIRFPRQVSIVCRHSRHFVTKMMLFVTMYIWSTTICQCEHPRHFLDTMKMFGVSHSVTIFQSYCISLCKKCLFSTSPSRLTLCLSLINYVLEGIMHVTKYVCKFMTTESTTCEQHFGQVAFA